MTREELEFDLAEAVNETYSRDRRNMARLRIFAHDAEQRQVIGNLYNRLALLKADDAERCTLIRDMEEEERKKDGEIEEQRQEIVRLREALKDAMNLIDVDNLTTQTVYRNCQQALKETTE